MPADERDIQTQRATFLTLIGLFLSLFAAFSRYESRRGDSFELRPFDLTLLGLATFRAGRIVAMDQVVEPLRAPFTGGTPNEPGQEPQGTGVRKALGDLITCPTCISTWIGAFLVYGLRLAPVPTRILLAILATTGIAELLDTTAETLYKTTDTLEEESGS